MKPGDVIFLLESGIFNSNDGVQTNVLICPGVIAFVLAFEIEHPDSYRYSTLTLIIDGRIVEFNCPQTYLPDFWRIL